MLNPEQRMMAKRAALKYLPPERLAQLPTCEMCHGKGFVHRLSNDGQKGLFKMDCPNCRATGKQPI